MCCIVLLVFPKCPGACARLVSAVAKQPWEPSSCCEDEEVSRIWIYGLYGLIMQISVECH